MIISQNHKIRIGTLENLSDFIQNLKERLDHFNLADRYQTQSMFKTLKNAVNSEHAFSRIKYHFKNFALLCTCNIIINPHLANFSDYIKTTNTSFAFITSMFWLLIPYLTSEIILYRRTARQADLASFTCPPPAPQLQKKVLLCSYLTAEIIYFALLKLIFNPAS